jgi:hypothetical protein
MVATLVVLDVERLHAVLPHVLKVHWLHGFVRTGHSLDSRSPLDLVPRQLERLYDCLCLSHRNEGVNALSALADMLREGGSDQSSNRCLLSINRHDDPHNVTAATRERLI